MSETWTESDQILCATINGHEYEVYETEPGMQRLRRNGRLIAETYTTEEAQRWAESYDKWLEQEAPKLPKKPVNLPEIISMADLIRDYGCTGWQRFPAYPNEIGAAK